MKFLPVIAAAFLLSGCVVGTVAKTAVDVATIPVKVVSSGVDAATTSQSEADEKRGREIRRREEKLAQLERDWRDSDEECREGDAGACAHRDRIGAEIDALLPTIPYEPKRD